MNWTTARAELRLLVGDPVGGIYSDGALDAALSISFHRVRTHHPEPILITATANSGDQAVTLSEDVIAVQSVSNGSWNVTPGTAADTASPAHTSATLMFHLHEPGEILLSRPIRDSEAGSWEIRATRIPPLPSNQAEVWPLPDALDGAVLYFAAADVLKTRAAQVQRRGAKADFSHQQQILTYDQNARRIVASYRRTARMT